MNYYTVVIGGDQLMAIRYALQQMEGKWSPDEKRPHRQEWGAAALAIIDAALAGPTVPSTRDWRD